MIDTTHPLDRALALSPLAPDRFAGATDPAWANMVGPYGGITAAALLQAALVHPARLGDPVALTANFAAPVADGPFEIEARAVRTNRATQHWTMAMTQAATAADGPVATATAVFGVRRPSWAAQEEHVPEMPAFETVPPAQGPVPIEWPRRYAMRFVRGEWVDFDAPATGAENSESLLWLRDAPARPLDFASLAAMCDVFYPRVFRRLHRFVPAGTISITVHFHAGADALAEHGDAPVIARAHGLRYVGGFYDQRAELWDPAGRLLATSQQSVYFKG